MFISKDHPDYESLLKELKELILCFQNSPDSEALVLKLSAFNKAYIDLIEEFDSLKHVFTFKTSVGPEPVFKEFLEKQVEATKGFRDAIKALRDSYHPDS